jgi:thymidylate synthase (FAD)
MTFLLAGLSRSLTHELVRHRIGVAFSQLSQRYVDSGDVNFVVPPDVQGMANEDPSLYAEWIAHCEASVALYKRIEQHIDLRCALSLSPRDRHKKARQAARSVLPNATETRMLFTANVRQLRHMIASRASAAADLEIRHLFIQIFDVLRDKYPLLAHGLSTVQLPDGTRGVIS